MGIVKKYLLDTCIWRDFYENRISKTGRPLGEYSHKLFMKIFKDKYQILYSESLIWELKKDYDDKEIEDMLNLLFLAKVLVRIEIAKEEHLEAKKLALERNIPFVDCLNAVHARNYKALLVSQDLHCLKNLKDIAKAVRPEEIS